jgi:hypothetical protein
MTARPSAFQASKTFRRGQWPRWGQWPALLSTEAIECRGVGFVSRLLIGEWPLSSAELSMPIARPRTARDLNNPSRWRAIGPTAAVHPEAKRPTAALPGIEIFRSASQSINGTPKRTLPPMLAAQPGFVGVVRFEAP